MKTNNYDYVDLDLPSGTLWATCNVGANSPEEYGKYFAWGETEGYYSNEEHDFDWKNYKYGNNIDYKPKLNKYNTIEDFGPVDNKIELELSDDAAHANMGGDWKMPTAAQMDELFKETNTVWVNDYQGTGVAGRVFTSKSDNSKNIFIPASGNRWNSSIHHQSVISDLWSSTLIVTDPDCCFFGYFDSDHFGIAGYGGRYVGSCVRGVLNKK